MKQYDYLIVGAGLYGACFAYLAGLKGRKCLVIDKRPHTGGNLYCEEVEGINVHKYGAHIFHTSDRNVWEFVNTLAEFNNYINSPVANYNGKLYNLPLPKDGKGESYAPVTHIAVYALDLPVLAYTAKYVREVDGRWSFTPEGFLLSNSLIGELLDALTEKKYHISSPWKQEDYYSSLF